MGTEVALNFLKRIPGPPLRRFLQRRRRRYFFNVGGVGGVDIDKFFQDASFFWKTSLRPDLLITR